MTHLQGKVAIITGAASGQGAAEAKLFVAEGAKVVVTDIGDGAVVAAQLGDHGHFIRHDVSDEAGMNHVPGSSPTPRASGRCAA